MSANRAGVFPEFLGEARGCGLWCLWRIVQVGLPRHRAKVRKAWQETSILYARAGKPSVSGEILTKCTLRQRFLGLKRTKYAILAEIGCPRVHFSEILPEKSSSAAQGYKMLVSCHSAMFRPPPSFGRACPRSDVGSVGFPSPSRRGVRLLLDLPT